LTIKKKTKTKKTFFFPIHSHHQNQKKTKKMASIKHRLVCFDSHEEPALKKFKAIEYQDQDQDDATHDPTCKCYSCCSRFMTWSPFPE
jgi:hypothetical protein